MGPSQPAGGIHLARLTHLHMSADDAEFFATVPHDQQPPLGVQAPAGAPDGTGVAVDPDTHATPAQIMVSIILTQNRPEGVFVPPRQDFMQAADQMNQNFRLISLLKESNGSDPIMRQS